MMVNIGDRAWGIRYKAWGSTIPTSSADGDTRKQTVISYVVVVVVGGRGVGVGMKAIDHHQTRLRTICTSAAKKILTG